MKKLNDFIYDVEQAIGYDFNNPDLLRQAFTRKSFATQFGGEHNEVLEFIGDKVIDYYVIKGISDYYGYFKSQSAYYDYTADLDDFCIVSNKDEADFTEIKKAIVSNKNLASIIDNFGFAELMRMGDSDIDNHVETQEKVKADLLEAIIGAITIDCDWNSVILEDVVKEILKVDEVLENILAIEDVPEKFKEENAINTLKELAEHGKCTIPEYDTGNTQECIDGEYLWPCTCYVRSWGIRETAYSKNKKEAKRIAAYHVLCRRYGLEPEV